jgi:hypothetical protein
VEINKKANGENETMKGGKKSYKGRNKETEAGKNEKEKEISVFRMNREFDSCTVITI